MKQKIILASSSKRRSNILKECGILHSIIISNVREKMLHERGARYNALMNACLKCESVSGKLRKGYVIGADTLVSLGKRIIGKPSSRVKARQLLKDFSGKTVMVYTGLCLKDIACNKILKTTVVSKVKVKKFNYNNLDTLIKLLGPHDKAGGFSIEGVGSFIFDDVEGSFYNILGLPMGALYELFAKLGVNLLDYIKTSHHKKI